MSGMDMGHIFKPALQDISLKRFRMRYGTYNDRYYLHWDNAVDPALSRISSLESGVLSMQGMHRYQDDSRGEVYLGCDDGVEEGEVTWKFDFSPCGLILDRIVVKACWTGAGEGGGEEEEGEEERGVRYIVAGDTNAWEVMLGDTPYEIPQLSGSSSVTFTALVSQKSGGEAIRLFPGGGLDCPLDIRAELKCRHHDDAPYVGEMLLGLKFSPRNKEGEGEESGGVVKVHVVEGAGLIDQETHKPFNAAVRCELLPDRNRDDVRQTSPRHNAYPTWTKEFVFSDVSAADLTQGGMEVLLCDHHRFRSDQNIGGIRMSVPVKPPQPRSPISSPSDNGSPVISRSASPTEILLNDESFRGNEEAPFSPSSLRSISPSTPPLLSPLLTAHPTHTFLRAKDSLYLPRGMPSKSKSLPNHPSPFLPVHPLFTRSHSRSPSPTLSPHTLSPTVITNGTSSPRGSPMSKAKSRFRLSGSHLKELTSPNRSPLLGRMKRWSSAASHDVNVENDFLYWWMDSTSGEVKHWQLMLERQGQWVYFWHALRANMKPAHS